MIKSSLNSYFSPLNSQKGQSTVYIIIFIVVIIFAVMLSGGGSSLLSGNEPSSVTETPTPSVTATDTSPSPSSGDSKDWNIVVTLDNCTPGKPSYRLGTAKVEGPANGTVELSVDDNGIKSIGTQNFTPPSTTFPITLSNADGFNINNWKIAISSSGNVQKTYEGKPTGCN